MTILLSVPAIFLAACAQTTAPQRSVHRTAALAKDKAFLAALRPVPPGWGSPVASGGNYQGFSVAIAGKTAVVSLPGFDNNAGSAKIYNYIFGRGGTDWQVGATLPDPRSLSDDEYAWAVAEATTKTTTYVAIGGNNSNGQPDLVYIYAGSGKKWKRQATITDPGGTYQDMFGDSLAMSSTTLVIGASCVNNNSGAAYIYQRTGTTWKLESSKQDPLDRANYDYGDSVAVSGNRVLVGANGAAYIYTVTPSHSWPLTATIRNPVESTDDFGVSAALSGTTAVIGAAEASSGRGAAYVYHLKGKTWSQAQRLTPPSSDGGEFAFSVAMTASSLLLGMPIYTGTANCGTAYSYKLSAGKWVVSKQIKDPKCTASAGFGYSVAISGANGAFGAPGTNNHQGASFELPIG